MPVIHHSAQVTYTQEQMYHLVDDIESYPQFIPACRESQIISRDADEVHAKLSFSKGAMHKSFSTCNRLHAHSMIEIRLVEGPFKHLEGFWRFDKVGETHCLITLDLEFEFISTWVSMMFGGVFHQVANMLVEAFCQRAKEIYD